MRSSLLLLLAMFSLSACSESPTETGTQPTATEAPAGSTMYTVRKGDYLVKIGTDLGVP